MRPALSRTLTALAAAALVVGCGPEGPPEQEAGTGPEVLAVYSGGTVTAEDVDQTILGTPTQEGRLAEEKTADWYEGLIRQIVADRLLLEEAKLLGVPEAPEFLASFDESRRQVMMEAYLARNPPRPEPVTNEDLRRTYDSHRERYSQPDRRYVLHIFRRREPGTSLDDLKAEVSGLRERLLQGESFARLAREHSDSETRHQGGTLGWVDPGKFPPALDKLLFSLPVGTPSEPIPTADGVHLFLVESAIEAKSYAFEEVKTVIRRQLEAERSEEAMARLVEDLPLPPGSFVADPEELRALVRGGDPRAVVLRIGDYELHLGRFRTLVADRRASSGGQQQPDLALRLLRFLEQRERIYLQATAQGIDGDPQVVERLAELKDRDLVLFYRRRALDQKLTREPERLQAYYESNRMRFAAPLRLKLRRLTVPLAAGDANAAMARLEHARAELDAGTTDLEALASELGGSVEDLGWRTLKGLGPPGSQAQLLAADLEAGGHSPPFRTKSTLELLEAVERREPEPPPLASILDRVRAAYLEDHRQELYRAWLEEVLAEAELRIFQDRVEDLAAGELQNPAAGDGNDGTAASSGT